MIMRTLQSALIAGGLTISVGLMTSCEEGDFEEMGEEIDEGIEDVKDDIDDGLDDLDDDDVIHDDPGGGSPGDNVRDGV